jgi:hypothetical protein
VQKKIDAAGARRKRNYELIDPDTEKKQFALGERVEALMVFPPDAAQMQHLYRGAPRVIGIKELSSEEYNKMICQSKYTQELRDKVRRDHESRHGPGSFENWCELLQLHNRFDKELRKEKVRKWKARKRKQQSDISRYLDSLFGE